MEHGKYTCYQNFKYRLFSVKLKRVSRPSDYDNYQYFVFAQFLGSWSLSFTKFFLQKDLKVLSSEMEPAAIRSFEKPLLKREAWGFKEKSARPLMLWEPFKDSAPPRTAVGDSGMNCPNVGFSKKSPRLTL
jgi:hypothetical protein